MKKAIYVFLVSVMVLCVTACSANTGTRSAGRTGAMNSTGEATGTGLSTRDMLAIGIFKLEGTNNDLTTDQANEILILWQAYEQLVNSDTAVQQEKTAVVNQVEETLTAEQLSAIKAMNLSANDAEKLIQERGLSTGSTSKTSNQPSSSLSNQSSSGRSGRNFGGGGIPGGGIPGGDSGMPMQGSGTMRGTTTGTPAAGRQPQGGGFVTEDMSQAIIKALIEMLQQKVA